MARIACLLPDENTAALMIQIAQNSALDIIDIRATTEEQALQDACVQLSMGAEIIISRGMLADLIETELHIPTIAIQISATGLEAAVAQAKTLVSDRPRLVMTGLSSTQKSLYYAGLLEKRYDVNISLCPQVGRERYDEFVRRELANGGNVLVGGDRTRAIADENNIPFIRAEVDAEAILEALDMAAGMAQAVDFERRHNDEFRTLLDYSLNGMIKIDNAGTIELVNRYVETLLDETETGLRGKSITAFFPAISPDTLARVFAESEEAFVRARIKNDIIALNIIPIHGVREQQRGALIVLPDSARIQRLQSKIPRAAYSLDYIATNTFALFPNVSQAFEQVKERARRIGAFETAVHISGPFGTEKLKLAQAIHNESEFSSGPFVHVVCDTLSANSDMSDYIFGSRDGGGERQSMVDLAMGGTLFLDKISSLNHNAQHMLYALINFQIRPRRMQTEFLGGKIRIITADNQPLDVLLQTGQLRTGLYYLLRSMQVVIPPIQERPEDIQAWLRHYLEQYMNRYGRYVKITEKAQKLLLDHDWPGGLPEIKSFCRSAIFLSPRRYVDEDFVLGNLAFKTEAENTESSQVHAERLLQVLRAHHGNRAASARALGISTTTLWRKIKKYGLSEVDWL